MSAWEFALAAYAGVALSYSHLFLQTCERDWKKSGVVKMDAFGNTYHVAVSMLAGLLWPISMAYSLWVFWRRWQQKD